MSAIQKFEKQFDKITTKKGEPWLEKVPAWTGDYAGVVDTGTSGLIYVRVDAQVVTVFNGTAPLEPNIPITIGRHKDQPQLWQVVSRREVWSAPSSPNTLHHHDQHEFPNADTVWVDRKQIIRLTLLVLNEEDSANFIMTVIGGEFDKVDGSVGLVDNQTVDLSSYVGGASAYYVAIETDEDGVLSVHTGTDFAAPQLATEEFIPVPDAGKYRIGYVLLFEGQEKLLNEHIRVPMPLATNPLNFETGGQISDAPADTPLDADKFGFWDVVDLALKSITWSNIKTTLKTNFDTLYAALGHAHDASTITYTPTTITDWTGSVDPGDVDESLDQLAGRVTALSVGAGGHLHGLARWNGASGQTIFDLPDIWEYADSLLLNGLEEDPFVYSLSPDGTQIVLDNALSSANNVIAHGVVRSI